MRREGPPQQTVIITWQEVLKPGFKIWSFSSFINLFKLISFADTKNNADNLANYNKKENPYHPSHGDDHWQSYLLQILDLT